MNHLYINKEWRKAIKGNTWPLINPADESVIAELSFGDVVDFKVAEKSAENAFKGWKKESANKKAITLKQIAQNILNHLKDFALDTVKETGKPFIEAEGEWKVAASFFDYYSEEVKRNYGKIINPGGEEKYSHIIYQPIGVVGVITSWNFPAYNPARAVSAAIAAGCSVILKGSAYTQLTSINFAKAIDESNLPAGVFNLVNGDATKIGNAIMESKIVRKVSFTGSTAVGKILMEQSHITNKKLSLELGGNAPVIIEKDQNPESIAKRSLTAKLRNCGQVCVAPQRFYVHKDIYNEFITQILNQLQKINLGINDEKNSFLGPLMNKNQFSAVNTIINNAKNEGCRIHTIENKMAKGFFVSPTIIEATQKNICIKDEIFGPVMIVIPFETKEEVVDWANDTEYGLAAYLFTNKFDLVKYYTENLEFGMIGVNEWAAHGTHLPFAGWKASGVGVESGAEGMREYLELKLITYSAK